MKRKNDKETAAGKTSAWKVKIGIYLAVWTACVVWFWVQLCLNRFSANGWFDTYNLLAFWVVIPAVTFLTAFSLERKKPLGLWRLVAIGFFGVLYLMAMGVTFALATFLGILHIGSPAWYELLGGSIPSAVGIVAGCALRNRKRQPEEK